MNASPGQLPAGAYLIFGLSGTGKSSVAKNLRELGYIAVDTDLDGTLSGWVNITTGQRLTSLPGFPLTQSWRNTHRWEWDSTRFKQLLRQSRHQPVFFCGDSDNIEDFFPEFRRRIGLYVDNSTMSRRLTTRDPKRWNNTDPELKELLNRNSAFVDTWQSDHVRLIDAARPIHEVVNDILESIQ